MPILALRTGTHGSATAFLTVIERTQETLMGVCVYMLVSLFVWPEEAQEKATPAENAPTGEKQEAAGTEKETPAAAAPQPAWFFPDLDRLTGAVNVFATFCLGGLLVFYVPAFPMGGLVLAMLPSVGMALATMPFVPLRVIYPPLATGILLGAVSAVLVLPHLTSFPQLAALLFIMTFGIAYCFFDPVWTLTRTIGLPFFFTMLHVSNVQQHDFLFTADMTLMMLVAMLILLATDHFPVSRMPEKRLVWQLRRFLHSARLFAEGPIQSANPLLHYRRAFHRYEIATLPQKLAFWQAHTPPEILDGRAEQLSQLLAEVSRISEQLLRNEDARESLETLSDGDLEQRIAGLARPRFF